MHIFFSGIGGAGIGPLALIAHQAGYDVSGSDKQDSSYIGYLREKGISNIHIGQDQAQLQQVHEQKPIDWLIYSSAVAMENTDHPELAFCSNLQIKTTKRNEFINYFIEAHNLELIALAGTHGKTTTTAMVIWAMQQLQIPISYSVGAKMPFADMGHYEKQARYFVYEADEFDRNFLSFYPKLSLITGIDWDHPDIYPTRTDYEAAFRDFLEQSEQAVLFSDDAQRLQLSNEAKFTILDQDQTNQSQLIGQVNRKNAALVAASVQLLSDVSPEVLSQTLNNFPGLSRRFEQIAEHIYSDYAHTPPKIRGALQTAQEIAHGANIVVVYEGLHNTRQHFIKTELADLFTDCQQVYVVPSYKAREDESLEDLTPEKISHIISQSTPASAMGLNENLQQVIQKHAQQGDVVLCLSAGGGGSLDEWLRNNF